PLGEIVIDFYDKIQSLTKGYASLDYEFIGYRKTEIVKLDLYLDKKKIEAFSLIVHKEKAESKARAIAEKLKELIPRQMYQVSVQVGVGGKIVAAERISALKKNVTAKCYGGDVTRKRKLWEKQKEGKKKMKQFGKVNVPQEAFLEVLKM
ncbi:MAG: elongation factor 4, partial [Candidatus Omnitrophica bacterium]|nr:elongation factor 4 [Candidatus Omnitrophota bacterium]